MRKMMAVARSEARFEVVECSEVAVCFGTRIEDDWWWRQDGV
jgi:hypothetical protein